MEDFRRIAVSGLSGSAGYVLVVEALDRHLVDFLAIREFFAELERLLKPSATKKVVLDLSRLQHCSSMALNGLIDLDDSIQAAGGALRLCGLNAEIAEIFAITRLDQRFSIAKDKQAALVSF